MPNPNSSLSFMLLTLFTPAERAESIHGDLLEEARVRGRAWFWTQVIGTTVALCWQGFVHAPLAVLRTTVFGATAWFLMTLVSLAAESPVDLALDFVGVPVDVPVLPYFLLGALLGGVVLGRVAPVQGIHAAVVLAFLSFPALGYLLFLPQPWAGFHDLRWIAVAFSGALFLVGSAFSRRRVMYSRQTL